MPIPYLLWGLAFKNALQQARQEQERRERELTAQITEQNRRFALDAAQRLLDAGDTERAIELFESATRPQPIPAVGLRSSLLGSLLGQPPRREVIGTVEMAPPLRFDAEGRLLPERRPQLLDPRGRAVLDIETEVLRKAATDPTFALTQRTAELTSKRAAGTATPEEEAEHVRLTALLKGDEELFKSEVFRKLRIGEPLTDEERAYVFGKQDDKQFQREIQLLRAGIEKERLGFEQRKFLSEAERRREEAASEAERRRQEAVAKAEEARAKREDRVIAEHARARNDIIRRYDARRRQVLFAPGSDQYVKEMAKIDAAEERELQALDARYHKRYPELVPAPEPPAPDIVGQTVEKFLGAPEQPEAPGQPSAPRPAPQQAPVRQQAPTSDQEPERRRSVWNRPLLETFRETRRIFALESEAMRALVTHRIPATFNNKQAYIEARNRGASPEEAIEIVKRKNAER